MRSPDSYGAGLRKFHIFCDLFSIAEAQRLPASFEVLHSFALWATAVPEFIPASEMQHHPLEPVAVDTARKYLSAVRAWHLAQGWPSPLSDETWCRINWSLRGLANLQGEGRRKPPRPPVTLSMLRQLKQALCLDSPFDACVWAAASCAFWGLMRFGEVTVPSRKAFSGSRHLKRADVFLLQDDKGRPVMKLWLPSAKTAKPGESQAVVVVGQRETCPLEAIKHLFQLVPAEPTDPLFSWRDARRAIRLLTKDAALRRIKQALSAEGKGLVFGHSFRIGGASFFLAQGVNPEIVRLAGRWKSLSYQTYVRAFEQIAPQHLSNME